MSQSAYAASTSHQALRCACIAFLHIWAPCFGWVSHGAFVWQAAVLQTDRDGAAWTKSHCADSHASDVATNMKPWQQQHTQTSPTHACVGPPIVTYSTLQNSTLSAHPAIADGEAVAKSGAQTCRSMTVWLSEAELTGYDWAKGLQLSILSWACSSQRSWQSANELTLCSPADNCNMPS